jgi:hypothetical protein
MLVWAQNRLKSFLVITTGGEITTLSLQLKRRGFRVMTSPTSYTLIFILIIAEGGSVWDKTKSFYKPLFKNAKYWSNKSHWGWAKNPNPREKASFLSENLFPIESSGALSYVSEHDTGFKHKQELNLEIMFVNGHTEKQMIPKIQYQNKTIVFAADLIPTSGHLPVPYVMGYDVKPLVSMSEKEAFLNNAVKNNYYLFLEHDAHNEIITLKNTEKGVRVDQSFSFNQLFN